MEQQKAASIKKVVKKKWYDILAPKEIFNQRVVGETLTANPEMLIGKTVAISMFSLTNDPKKQNTILKLKIISTQEGKAITQLQRYEVLAANVKRMTKRTKKKIEDSFKAETKDKLPITIKPLLLTHGIAHQNTLTDLRNKTREYMKDLATKNSYMELIDGVISTRIQKDLRGHLKKIYPIQICEIRVLERA